MNKTQRIISLTLIALLLLLAMPTIALSAAQNNATVIVLDAPGGTTDITGTTTYPDGSTVTITATPDATTDVFSGWTVSSTAGDSYNSLDNPISFTVKGGVTYALQPSFQQLQPIPGQSLPTTLSTAAVVVILASAGGTVSPAPGSYALADASNFNLTAKANSGWQFSNWIISGPNLSHGGYPFTATPTDNPYNVNHGYGNTFTYQAVFTPVGGSTTPTPSSGSTAPPGGSTAIGASMIDIVIIVVLVVIVIALIAVVALRRRK